MCGACRAEMRARWIQLLESSQIPRRMRTSINRRRRLFVAFPTETVYGLGADGMSEDAARKIYAAKGRPTDNPLILHIADRKDLERITDKVTEDADKLMTCFWPGPLTLIFEKRKEVPYGITRCACLHIQRSES